jgi:hypothetical protein
MSVHVTTPEINKTGTRSVMNLGRLHHFIRETSTATLSTPVTAGGYKRLAVIKLSHVNVRHLCSSPSGNDATFLRQRF